MFSSTLFSYTKTWPSDKKGNNEDNVQLVFVDVAMVIVTCSTKLKKQVNHLCPSLFIQTCVSETPNLPV